MPDINFVIGAKDAATKPMQQVQSSMDRLKGSTKQLADASEKSVKKMDISFSSLAKGAGVMKAVDLAVQGLHAAWSAFTGSIASANAAFDTQTEAVKGLETALRLNGEEVENQSGKFQTFASDMQALTGVGDEVTLGLMRQASMLGVSSDQLDDVSRATIGLSEATGKSLDESLKLVKNSLEGEFGAFGEIIPAIKQATTAEEKLAMVQSIAAKGLDAKAESADRLSGMTERANGAVGDMLEQVGALLAPMRLVIAQGIKAMAEAMTTILIPAVAKVQSLFEQWGPFIMQVMENVINSVVAMVTAAEVFFGNFGDIAQMAADKVMLTMESMRAFWEHLFTVQLPAYVTWFADNFYNIMRDALDAVLTVVVNLGEKIRGAFSAIWEFILSGGQTDMMADLGAAMGGSLLEGFRATTESLPDIAARSITAREQELQNRIGKVAGSLADEFNKKYAERAISLGGMFGEGVDKTIGLAFGGAAGGAGGGNKGAALQATQGRLLTRGSGDKTKDYLSDIAQATKKTAREVRSMSDSMSSESRETRRELAELDSIEFVGVN